MAAPAALKALIYITTKYKIYTNVCVFECVCVRLQLIAFAARLLMALCRLRHHCAYSN